MCPWWFPVSEFPPYFALLLSNPLVLPSPAREGHQHRGILARESKTTAKGTQRLHSGEIGTSSPAREWYCRSTWAIVSDAEPSFFRCFVTVHAPEVLSEAGSGTLLHARLATLPRAFAPFRPWRQKPFWILHQRTSNNIRGVLLRRMLHVRLHKNWQLVS